MESASGEASISTKETKNNESPTKIIIEKDGKAKTDDHNVHVNKSRSPNKDDEIDKKHAAKAEEEPPPNDEDTKQNSETPEKLEKTTLNEEEPASKQVKRQEKLEIISKQETTTTKISQLPELTATQNAPIIPVDILSPPKSESQTDETNTASTSPASEATMSPKLEIVEETAAKADIITSKPGNSKLTKKSTNKKPTATTVANGTIPKSGGKPLLSAINKKMNQLKKPTKKRRPKPAVALYESEISQNTQGIKLCIKKSDLSSTLLNAGSTAKAPASTGASTKNRKRSRKPKTKDDKEVEAKRKKERSTNNNDAKEAAVVCVDQSVWGEKLPEEVLYQIFQYVVGKDSLPTLFRLGKVCTLWRRVSLRPSLWKSLDLSNMFKEKHRTELKLKWFIDNRCNGCTELNVANWKITNTDCVLQKMSACCPNLESINLTGWKGLSCDHLAFLVENMKKLGRLDLSSINSEMNPARSAVNLPSLRNALEGLNGRLTHLYLAHNRLPGIPQIVEALASNCPNLLLLDLSNVFTYAASHGVLHVEKLQHGCPKLKVLRVTNSRMSLNASTMQEMMDSPGFPNLEELSVAAQSGEESRVIGDEHLQRILKTSSKLKLLDVRGCMRLTHESLIRLPAWDIKHLFLSGCSVTRDFSSRLELIASKWAHSLIELDLAWTNVQQPLDNALRVIAEKGLESPLAHLNLCGSSVSEDAVKDILAHCAYLSSINLASCRGLPRGVKRLIQGPKELHELRETLKVQMKVKLPSKAVADKTETDGDKGGGESGGGGGGDGNGISAK